MLIYTSPRGVPWNNKYAKGLSNLLENKDIVFVCGRYEGIDERFIQKYVNQEISIGDYVLSGGELAASVILDSSLRFSPQVLGNCDSFKCDSFENGLLDSPKYTRQRVFEEVGVPEVLLSGDHKKMKHIIEKV